MPQLDPSTFTTQLFWLFVTFMALFMVAWKVALPRITEVRNARQNRIDDLDKAEGLKSEAETVIEAYEKALAEAAAEAQALHRQAAQELADERTKRQEELARTLSDRARAAESQIAEEKQHAIDNIRDATLEVVRGATERLIDAEIAESDAEAAIQAVMAERRS
jgi:F-type H+-transporting ATPase subunit b